MVLILLAGAIAGFAATVVLIALMRPLTRGEPGAAALLAARLNGRPAERNEGLGAALHLAYGTAMGALFAWGLDAWAGIQNYTFPAIVGAGLLFGVAVWLLSAFFWTPVSGLDRRLATVPGDVRRGMAVAFLGLHLVYGLALAGVLQVIPKESSAPRLTDGILLAALALLGVMLSIGIVTRVRHQHDERRRRRATGLA